MVYDNWDVENGQPNDAGGAELCVLMTSAGNITRFIAPVARPAWRMLQCCRSLGGRDVHALAAVRVQTLAPAAAHAAAAGAPHRQLPVRLDGLPCEFDYSQFVQFRALSRYHLID